MLGSPMRLRLPMHCQAPRRRMRPPTSTRLGPTALRSAADHGAWAKGRASPQSLVAEYADVLLPAAVPLRICALPFCCGSASFPARWPSLCRPLARSTARVWAWPAQHWPHAAARLWTPQHHRADEATASKQSHPLQTWMRRQARWQLTALREGATPRGRRGAALRALHK
jgi:hypothetical protein